MKARTSKGLTLAELILSFGILAFVALVVAGLFIFLLKNSAKTNDLTAGRVLAQNVLDRAVQHGPPDWGFPSGNGREDLTTHDSRTDTEFIYTVRNYTLRPPDNAVSGISRTFYYVEVEVRWWDTQGAAGRTEMGELSTKVSQVVNYEEQM